MSKPSIDKKNKTFILAKKSVFVLCFHIYAKYQGINSLLLEIKMCKNWRLKMRQKCRGSTIHPDLISYNNWWAFDSWIFTYGGQLLTFFFIYNFSVIFNTIGPSTSYFTMVFPIKIKFIWILKCITIRQGKLLNKCKTFKL